MKCMKTSENNENQRSAKEAPSDIKENFSKAKQNKITFSKQFEGSSRLLFVNQNETIENN